MQFCHSVTFIHEAWVEFKIATVKMKMKKMKVIVSGCPAHMPFHLCNTKQEENACSRQYVLLNVFVMKLVMNGS